MRASFAFHNSFLPLHIYGTNKVFTEFCRYLFDILHNTAASSFTAGDDVQEPQKLFIGKTTVQIILLFISSLLLEWNWCRLQTEWS